MICKTILVFGRVQGVGFRNWTFKKAIEIDVSGIVKNMEDSTVYIEVKGEQKNVDLFIKSCSIGPTLSKVNRLEITEVALLPYTDFKIIRK